MAAADMLDEALALVDEQGGAMLAPVPGEAVTLAQSLGVCCEPKISFSQACSIAVGLQGGVTPRPSPVPRKLPVGPLELADLPIELVSEDLGSRL